MHHLLVSGSVKFINKGGGRELLGASSPVKDSHTMGKWYPQLAN